MNWIGAKALAKDAGNAWVEYSEKNAIVGPIRAAVHAIGGDDEEADRVLRSTGNAIESVVDKVPVVGHVKGVVHYALGETNRGDECMIGASGTTAAVGAGLVTGGLGAGAVAGVIAGTTVTRGRVGAIICVYCDSAIDVTDHYEQGNDVCNNCKTNILGLY